MMSGKMTTCENHPACVCMRVCVFTTSPATVSDRRREVSKCSVRSWLFVFLFFFLDYARHALCACVLPEKVSHHIPQLPKRNKGREQTTELSRYSSFMLVCERERGEYCTRLKTTKKKELLPHTSAHEARVKTTPTYGFFDMSDTSGWGSLKETSTTSGT